MPNITLENTVVVGIGNDRIELQTGEQEVTDTVAEILASEGLIEAQPKKKTTKAAE